MITGAIKNKVDKIWTDIWAGGITNPLTVIEQLTYLMFIRSLDEKELETEEFENMTDEKMDKIFPQSPAGQSMRWSKFKNITLPELKPLCVFVFITVTIGAFRMIVQPMVMTGGGPSHSTYTIVYDIYETGTVNWEIGLASAMAIVFTVFVVILTMIQTFLTKDKEEKHENKKAKNR